MSSTSLEEYAIAARAKIKEHATKAIAALQDQLLTAKSPARVSKLKSRIESWQKSLEILEEKQEHS
jgi:chromosome segregation ATPase